MIRLCAYKRFICCLVAFLCFSCFAGLGFAFAGDLQDPYVIKTCSQLLQISDKGCGIIYQIRGTINLDGNTVTIPKDCTLQFKRGKIKNGRVFLHNTSLEGKVNLLCDVEGSVSNKRVQMDWFVKGASKLKKLKNSTGRIQAIFNLGAKQVVFGKGYYQFNNVKIGNNVEIVGNGTIIRPVVLDQNEYDFNFLKNVF